MRLLAFMLLLIGGASAGVTWHQGYGWEDLRCSIEENRWGCEDETVVVLSSPDADQDRVRCGEIEAAGPRDDAEGLWFLAHCIEPEELARLVEQQRHLDVEPPPVRTVEEWTVEDCDALYGWEFYGADGVVDAQDEKGMAWWRATCAEPVAISRGNFPAGMMITEDAVTIIWLAPRDRSGGEADGATILGRRLRTVVSAQQALLEDDLCPIVGCEEVGQ